MKGSSLEPEIKRKGCILLTQIKKVLKKNIWHLKLRKVGIMTKRPWNEAMTPLRT